MAQIKLTETLLQGGFESFTASTMSIQELLPVLSLFDGVGYHSIAAWGSKTYEDCIRELGEDPWTRLRILREEMPNTKLQMSLAGQSLLGYHQYADDVVGYFVERSVANGIDILRIYDPLNNILNVEQAIKIAKREGALVEGGIAYSSSMVHNSIYFLGYAKQLKNEGVDSICIMDEGGSLTPYAAYDLVRDIKKTTQLPVQVHCRNASGMSDMVYLKAAEAGAEYLDVSLTPFALGPAVPSTQSLIAALESTPYTTLLSLHSLDLAQDYFIELKEKKKSDIPDINLLLLKKSGHQLSTTMITSLSKQLQKAGRPDRLWAVLEEVSRIREESGCPTLIPPLAQIIGSQALINNLSDQRYATVSKEFRGFVRGRYGRSPAMMDVAFRQKIIGDRHPLVTRAADQIEPDLERLREEIPTEYFTQPEDILTLALFPEESGDYFEKRSKQVSALEQFSKGKESKREE